MKRWVLVDIWGYGSPVVSRHYTRWGAQRTWNKHPRKGLLRIEKRL